MSVTVYTTGPACYKCKATKNMLTKLGITYTEQQVTEEAKAKVEELNLPLIAPIVHAVVEGEDVWWTDYRPTLIGKLPKS